MIRDPLVSLLSSLMKVPRRARTNNRRPAVSYAHYFLYFEDPEVLEAAYSLMMLRHWYSNLPPPPSTEPVTAAKRKRVVEYDGDDGDDCEDKKMKISAEDDDDDDRENKIMKISAEDDDHDDYNKPSSSRNAENRVKKARTIKKRDTRPVINDGPEPSPSLSEEFVNAINAMAQGRAVTQEPMLVIEKKISPTDLNHIHNRLAIPYKQVASPNFLSERESQRLLEREAKLKKDGRPFKNKTPCSLEVKVIVPSLESVTMNLRRWEMNSSCIYALTNKWTDIARKNGILVDTVIRVWAFRIDGEENLCFVLGIKNQ